ncbi:hypothetical protein ACFYXF_45020 [Streptomyces sp. NPDC002680]|uniref:hypothetical protein n=1 Tax=Streptomyces sp. NPDC002680 TaxID=3364659 RepID=UPI00368EA459
MTNTFKYRLRSPLGGLAADLTGEHRTPGASEEFHLQIYRNVWMTPPGGVNWRDSAWLSFGLSVHAPVLAATHPDGLIIKVVSLAFPLAHYRSEVAALAMDGWVREEFGLPDQGLRAVSREEGGYVFQWGDYPAPFSDVDFN